MSRRARSVVDVPTAKFSQEQKQRIRAARIRAALSVNRELIRLYWQIGRAMLERQAREGWGAKVIERLGEDLRREFPEMKGFPPRKLKYMCLFAEAYPDEGFVQQVAAQIPWFHQCVILTKVKDPALREWYMRACIEHGWSRAVLEAQIESRRHERSGRAITNFSRTLPGPQSELAQQILKKLRAFVVVELKATEFRPEFAGKLNFYLSAVDNLLRHPQDNPTIGILLCKGRNRVIVEYALRDVHKPIGVPEYQLAQALPEHLKGSLPTVEQLEAELKTVGDEEQEGEAVGYGG